METLALLAKLQEPLCSPAWWTNDSLSVWILLIQSGELSYVVWMKTLKISVALKQQRFISHTRGLCVSSLQQTLRDLGWWDSHCLEPSWWLLLRERALGGCTLASTCSQWWSHVPSVLRPVASTVRHQHRSVWTCSLPPMAWKESLAVLVATTAQLNK